ncbi:hypothetical protein MRX96_044228 [Rhipicephalus microplus]
MRRSPPFRVSFKDATRSLLPDPDSPVIGDGPAQRLIPWLVFGRRSSLVRRRTRASQTLHGWRPASASVPAGWPRKFKGRTRIIGIPLPGSLQPRENSGPLCYRGSALGVHATTAASKVAIQRSPHKHSFGVGPAKWHFPMSDKAMEAEMTRERAAGWLVWVRDATIIL